MIVKIWTSLCACSVVISTSGHLPEIRGLCWVGASWFFPYKTAKKCHFMSSSEYDIYRYCRIFIGCPQGRSRCVGFYFFVQLSMIPRDILGYKRFYPYFLSIRARLILKNCEQNTFLHELYYYCYTYWLLLMIIPMSQYRVSKSKIVNRFHNEISVQNWSS